jgi:hypothetical protein
LGRSQLEPIDAYVVAVAAACLAVLVALAPSLGLPRETFDFWLLTGLVVLGELVSAGPQAHRGRRGDHHLDHVRLRNPARLRSSRRDRGPGDRLRHGDLVRRKAPSKMLFNISQYVLSLTAAGIVLAGLDGARALAGAVSGRALVQLLASGAAFPGSLSLRPAPAGWFRVTRQVTE